MKNSLLALCITLLSASISCHAEYQEREFNVWYQQNAVLYDVTQTSDGRPVMISISQAGFKSANMVISYSSAGTCAKEASLDINKEAIPADYTCVQTGKEKIEHFVVRDAGKVNALVDHLKSDFTLLIQNDIKVWAANIKAPKYGMAPRF